MLEQLPQLNPVYGWFVGVGMVVFIVLISYLLSRFREKDTDDENQND